MAKWTAFPYDQYDFDGAKTKKQWARLHVGDAEQLAEEPKNPNAHYWLAYAIGRYGQGISVAKALAQGLCAKLKTALETTLALAPKHADAHIALGTFHAE